MKAIYFISDVHIGAGNKSQEAEKFDRLTSFLHHINQPDNELFIVGDLFDFWFEYKHVIPNQYFDVLFELAKLIENQVPIHFLPGNHDGWIRNFFADQMKIQVHPEIFTAERQGKRLFLFHGDGISQQDVGYRWLKKVFRNPVNIFLFRLLHPDLGIPLAKLMSHGSRQHTSHKVFDDESDYLAFATAQFHAGFDVVIVGHSHKPLLKEVEGHWLINLGDWIDHYSYGQLTDGNLSLHFWNG